MTDAVCILCCCGDRDEALRIASALVEERLAACVNLLPQVQSVYRWQGKIESTQEVLLIIKTARERWPVARDRIVSLHSYDTPEVLLLPVADGLEKYLGWLRGQI